MTELLAFAVVFGTIALFEIIDRTNFALISLAAREPPVAVWAGATAAFGITTLLSVAIGAAAVTFLRPELWLLRLAGGGILLAYAGYLALHHGQQRPPAARSSALATAFLLILLLELGDTTMILTVGFVFTYTDPIVVGLAAFLGLASVAASSSILGPRIGARVEPVQLERWLIVILAVVGVATILYALDPGAFSALG